MPDEGTLTATPRGVEESHRTSWTPSRRATILSAGRLMGGHVGVSDTDHDLLDETERRIYDNMEIDREREMYLLSRFQEYSVIARKNKRRVKVRGIGGGW